MWPFKSSITISDDDIFADLKSILKELQKDDEMTLVSPYIRFDEKVREVLDSAITNGARIRLLFRAGEKREPVDAEFLANRKVEVKELQYLHAKVYIAPFVAMVTSMNLFDFSDRKSKEICIFLEDKSHLKEVAEIVNKWWNAATPLTAKDLLTSVSRHGESQKNDRGYCIRCGAAKTYNAKFPHCDNCYTKWAEYKNDSYGEKYCHKCGKQAKTTKRDPICSTCQR